MENIIGKLFKDRNTGQRVQVLNVEDGIAYMSNEQRVAVDRISNFFLPDTGGHSVVNENVMNNMASEPVVNFNNNSIAASLMNQIKNIDTSRMSDNVPDRPSVTIVESVDEKGSAQRAIQSQVGVKGSAVVQAGSPEDEAAEIQRKFVERQLRSQNKHLSEVELEQQVNAMLEKKPASQPNQTNTAQSPQPAQQTGQSVTSQSTYQPQNNNHVENPIITIFKGAKRKNSFKMDVSIEGLIPREDFIEMMEENYELSIIEFFADEFTNKLLADPTSIRNQIIEKLREKVYGKVKKKEKKNAKNEIEKSEPIKDINNSEPDIMNNSCFPVHTEESPSVEVKMIPPDEEETLPQVEVKMIPPDESEEEPKIEVKMIPPDEDEEDGGPVMQINVPREDDTTDVPSNQ